MAISVHYDVVLIGSIVPDRVAEVWETYLLWYSEFVLDGRSPDGVGVGRCFGWDEH